MENYYSGLEIKLYYQIWLFHNIWQDYIKYHEDATVIKSFKETAVSSHI